MLKIADEARQLFGKEEPFSPGHILAKRHKMNLVVDEVLRATWAKENCAVVRANPAGGQRLPIDHADQKAPSAAARDMCGASVEFSILHGKRRRNLRPHYDAGNFLRCTNTDLFQLI